MDVIEYNNKIKELDEELDSYDEKIDQLCEKKRNCFMKKHKLEQAYNAERLKGLKLEKDNVVVGFAKEKDYHFQMIKSFVVSQVSSVNHIKTIEQVYSCNDFDYSYRGDNKNISLNDILDMFNNFHVYVFSMDVYKELFFKMSMLEVNIENFDSVAATYTAQAIQKISGEI